jgi:signal transduction histidine kinase
MPSEDRHIFDDDEAPLVAHELRAPLTVIRGYLEKLARPLDEETRQMALGSAGRAVDRLDTLLDDLIASSAEQAVFAPQNFTRFSLRELATQVIDEMVPLADHTAEVTGDEGNVEADERLVRQAIANLVSNAFKHTPPDGRVAIEVADGDGSVLLRVEDDGPGVPPEARERVFELFERIGTPRKRTDGLGVGLPVARSIVRQHGGDLRLVESETGAGACFEMVLPVEPPASS